MIDRGRTPVKQHTVIAHNLHVPTLHLRSTFAQNFQTSPKMNVLILLSLLFFVAFLFFLVYLALSSCMGDGFRARVGGMTFSRSYARGMRGSAGAGGWEQIEMEDMLGEDSEDED
jgi:hypothetical protein